MLKMTRSAMQQREGFLPLKFLLFILKFRGAKGFEDTILPPETQRRLLPPVGRQAHTRPTLQLGQAAKDKRQDRARPPT